MPSPFPGMDPYLEHPDIWPDVHNRAGYARSVVVAAGTRSGRAAGA